MTLSRKAEGISNPYKLPRGERLRRELVKVFAAQQAAIVRYLRTGKKDLGPPIPFAFPDFHDFGLGALDISQRMTPILTATWEAAAGAFAPRVGLDPSVWEVVNPNTARMIEEAALAFCESTNDTTSLQLDEAIRKLKEELNAGIVDVGESLELLTGRVKAIFDKATTARARRIAWTETSRAVHAAQEQAAIQSGVVTGWEWLASGDACPTCVAIAARCRFVRLGQPFAVIGDDPNYATIKFPPAHPHCCLPETPVIAPIAIAGIKAHYDGPVVRIHLSDGSDVTVTPNHMLLTPQGFALAGGLVEGDDVLRYRMREPIAGGYPHDDGVPTPIGEIFDSLAKSAGVPASRVPVSPEYLHGDAALCKGQIDIVSADGLLGHDVGAEGFQPLTKDSFGWADISMAYLPHQGGLAKALFALRDATDGGVGLLRERKARALAHLREPVASGIGTPAQVHSRLFQMADDGRSADAKRLGEAQDRLAGKVATCQVREVERSHYAGPVYDITTGTSLYLIGNGIVSSNCNCTMVEVLDTDGQPTWGGTLHDPDPATDEEHDEIARELMDRYERIPNPAKRQGPAPIRKPVPLSRKRLRIPTEAA